MRNTLQSWDEVRRGLEAPVEGAMPEPQDVPIVSDVPAVGFGGQPSGFNRHDDTAAKLAQLRELLSQREPGAAEPVQGPDTMGKWGGIIQGLGAAAPLLIGDERGEAEPYSALQHHFMPGLKDPVARDGNLGQRLSQAGAGIGKAMQGMSANADKEFEREKASWRKGQPVSALQAETLVSQYGMDPKTAAGTTLQEWDEMLPILKSTGYAHQNALSRLQRGEVQQANVDVKREGQQLRSRTAASHDQMMLHIAKLRATMKRPKPTGNPQVDAEADAKYENALIATFGSANQLPNDEARAIWERVKSGQQTEADAPFVNNIELLRNAPENAMKPVLTAAANIPGKQTVAENNIVAKQLTPADFEKALKEVQPVGELRRLAFMIHPKNSAVTGLTDHDIQQVLQLGGDVGDAATKLGTDAQTRLAANVKAYVNELTKLRSGQSVTANEIGRLAGEMGVNLGGTTLGTIFGDTRVFREFIARSLRAYAQARKTHNMAYPNNPITDDQWKSFGRDQ